MADYKKLYHQLFASAADAVEALDHWNLGQAREILIRAQRQAEETILNEEETGETG